MGEKYEWGHPALPDEGRLLVAGPGSCARPADDRHRQRHGNDSSLFTMLPSTAPISRGRSSGLPPASESRRNCKPRPHPRRADVRSAFATVHCRSGGPACETAFPCFQPTERKTGNALSPLWLKSCFHCGNCRNPGKFSAGKRLARAVEKKVILKRFINLPLESSFSL